MKKIKKPLIIFAFIILIATIFISVGLYLNKISKPKYIYSKIIDIYKTKLDKYINIPKDLDLDDNYDINGNINFDLDSEFYKKDNKKNNLINNLNKLDTSFIIQKDKSKNMAYIELNEKISKEEILNANYYIADSTKYYFVNNILKEYINDGGCNYFESINKDTTGLDNINYLYNFIIESLKNNLSDKYFTTTEEKDLYIISIKLNENNVKNIFDGVLNDLKKDKRSRNILDNIDKSILKTKFNEDLLEKDEYYKISIYTTKILHNPIKYELEHTIRNDKETYIYDGNENKATLYYLVNDISKYIINISSTSKDITATIKDATTKKIGEFRIEKDGYNTTISYTFDDSEEKLDYVYSSKYTNVVKNKKFDNTKNLSFKYIVNKETKLNGTITMNLKVKQNPNILVDVSNAKLKSNLLEDEKTKLNKLEENIKNRLER